MCSLTEPGVDDTNHPAISRFRGVLSRKCCQLPLTQTHNRYCPYLRVVILHAHYILDLASQHWSLPESRASTIRQWYDSPRVLPQRSCGVCCWHYRCAAFQHRRPSRRVVAFLGEQILHACGTKHVISQSMPPQRAAPTRSSNIE